MSTETTNRPSHATQPLHGALPDLDRDPMVVFVELTQACALACRHCRASARPQRHPEELTTEECFRLLDETGNFDRKPIVILSGGDPFMRRDLFDIAAYGIDQGLSVSVSPSATALLTRARLQRLKDLGVSRVSFSLDGATADTHDAFRGFPGTFDKTIRAMADARDVGLPFQVHTTVSQQTLEDLRRMPDVLEDSGAALWNLFFLVPVGRGQARDLLSPEEHESLFDWVIRQAPSWPFAIRSTLGQHFRRAQALHRRDRAGDSSNAPLTKEEVRRLWPGPPTNDGKGAVFVSHTGHVWPSGFLPLSVGNVRESGLVDLYRNAPLMRRLRTSTSLTGKCAVCPFNEICGGSRARAFAMTGSPFGPEPCCSYVAPVSTEA